MEAESQSRRRRDGRGRRRSSRNRVESEGVVVGSSCRVGGLAQMGGRKGRETVSWDFADKSVVRAVRSATVLEQITQVGTLPG